MRKRDKGLYVRCGEDELAAWKQAASKEGLGHSEWIRRTLTSAALSRGGGDGAAGGTAGHAGATPAESATQDVDVDCNVYPAYKKEACRLERFHRKDAYCVACERTQ